ncbi:Uncharacterised protein [Edwardsiella hoshinae]|uniref:Uncharacterized protein n=1 Tax=Edwardsiella hoshinae TaxID=93378 RepID=A0A376DKP9_9GAMM|nr:Uncharacterised protein [Edwardsiella hoshinae]
MCRLVYQKLAYLWGVDSDFMDKMLYSSEK